MLCATTILQLKKTVKLVETGIKIYLNENTMKEKIKEFKQHWGEKYSFIELTLTDIKISQFIDRYSTIELACNGACDYLLSQGDADVQE